MENNLTLEQELRARIFLHKASIAGGVLAREYIDRELQQESSVSIPKSQLEELADQYSNEIVQKAINEGTFNSLYENAWDKIKDTIPEYLKVL